MADLLRADRLSRRAGGAVLLEEVSFGLEAGDVFVVFGPSGAGKSTLLRLLNRLDEPTSGTVYLDGMDYRDLPPQEVRKRIGLVPQAPTLLPGSVADNVAWGPRLRDEPVDRDRVDRMLARLGLDGFSDRAAGELSGGEAQRVAIARTLFNEPDVLLLDEPASSLDAGAARQVESLIETTATAFARAAVLVTHDADRARRLGTRGLRLDGGRVRARGSVTDVLPEPAVSD
jgi:putative ABC transport system ATP-binding protein